MRPDDTERRIQRWLDEGPEQAPDDLIESILAHVPATRRRPRWALAERPLHARVAALLSVAVVLVLVVALSSVWLGRIAAPGTSTSGPGPFVRLATADFGNESISDAITVGSGIEAVSTASIGGRNSVAVWTSPDGLAWARSPSDPAFVDTTAGRLAELGNRVVLTAYSCPAGGIYCSDSRLFGATGGGPWQAATGINAGFSYNAIAAGATGFVAVGTEEDAYGDVNGVVATSIDGSSWSEATPFAMTGATIGGVAAGPNGLVAVGQVRGQGVVWRSPDGLTWTPIGSPPTGGTLTDVAQVDSHWVAVGSGARGSMAWTSSDGTTWRPVPTGSGLDGSTVDRIISIGSQLIALGESTSGDGVAWQSSDGTSWTRLQTGDIFTKAAISAAALINGRLVLFGASASGQAIVAVGAP
jgi:hypothetical protein